MSEELYIGLMCGTSMDSIDAALVSFGENTAHCVETYRHPLPEVLKRQALHLSICDKDSPEYEDLDTQFGDLFSEASLKLLEKAKVSASAVIAIGSHGQTIRHCPDADPGYSLQLGNPQLIASKTNILTVSDFRNPDIQEGGQGAPLAPAFHRWCLRSKGAASIVINLGGIANITWLPTSDDEPVLGWDVGPANALLDAWSHRFLKKPFDEDGQWARGGHVHNKLLDAFLEDPYFHRSPPKSTGKSYFNLDWVDLRLQSLDISIRAQDVQCTLVHLTVRLLASAIHSLSKKAQVTLCGGGVYNGFFCETLKEQCGAEYEIQTSETFGIDPQWVESACFAWLARERLAGRPGNCPSVTGAKNPVLLGTITEAP